MRFSRVMVMAVLAISLWATSVSAQAKQAKRETPPLGTNPNPVGRTSPPPKPNPPPPPPKKKQAASKQPASKRPDGKDAAQRNPDEHPDGRYRHCDDYPYYPYGYGYDPYYYSVPVPYYVPVGPGYGSPNYGGAGYGSSNAGNRSYSSSPSQQADEEPPAPQKLARSTNAQANATAWKSIGFGDALFAKQRYAEAADRYRRASNTAPQLADAWFRRAFALTATGRYDTAVRSINRGLKLDPKWPDTAFEATDALWPDLDAKKEYFTTLEKIAEDKPEDADVQFLVGVHFHVDGQDAKAQKYFARAKRIAGSKDEHIAAFFKSVK
jgi:tetratricopeptide (TPR) repeat protein